MADNLTPTDVGIELSDGKPQQLYRWFLASILFGKPIQDNDYGSVHHLVTSAHSRRDLANTVQQFQGVGAVTARIFTEQIPANIIGSA